MRGNADKHFMKHTGKQEGEKLRERRMDTTTNHGSIDVPLHEMRDRFVPGRPVFSNTYGVPPVAVELSVSETENFCEGIEERLEQGEKSCEPADQTDSAEFHDSFQDVGAMKFRDVVQAILQQRHSVLSARKPD